MRSGRVRARRLAVRRPDSLDGQPAPGPAGGRVVRVALAAVALVGTIGTRNPVWLGVLLCATFFGNDLAMGPAWAACADIGERSAATLGGTMNMIGSFTGAAGAGDRPDAAQRPRDAAFHHFSGRVRPGCVPLDRRRCDQAAWRGGFENFQGEEARRDGGETLFDLSGASRW